MKNARVCRERAQWFAVFPKALRIPKRLDPPAALDGPYLSAIPASSGNRVPVVTVEMQVVESQSVDLRVLIGSFNGHANVVEIGLVHDLIRLYIKNPLT